MDTMDASIRHARCLAEQLNKCSARYIVHIALKELGVPSGHDGFPLAKSTILMLCENPFCKLRNGAYLAAGTLAEPPMGNDQVDQAIRRAIQEAWSERTEKWDCYFPVGKPGRVECPTNRAFLTAVADFVELWQGCCEEVNYARQYN